VRLGLQVDVNGTETNIVMIEIEENINMTAQVLLEELEERQVLALSVGACHAEVDSDVVYRCFSTHE